MEGHRVDVNKVFVKIKKKKLAGSGGGEELKFL